MPLYGKSLQASASRPDKSVFDERSKTIKIICALFFTFVVQFDLVCTITLLYIVVQFWLNHSTVCLMSKKFSSFHFYVKSLAHSSFMIFF